MSNSSVKVCRGKHGVHEAHLDLANAECPIEARSTRLSIDLCPKNIIRTFYEC